ncbi:MAG: CoA transferase [Burkholderiales bacterium]|nr:CoA transferase [Burkholderiales bacterium]
METTLPLSGLKVVELHAIGPVPYVGFLLRSLGASVQRVSPPVDPGLGVARSPQFDVLNVGKEQLLVDLKTPDGQRTLHKSLATADVLLEGFRPGVLERLGLAPASLEERYPRLVIGRLSGWGSAGELAPRAGHDINYMALTGVLNAIGTAQTPVPPLNLVADFGGGAMHLLVGVLARLVRRSIDGQGGVAQTSILAGTVGLTPMFYGMLAEGRWSLTRGDNMLDGGAPFYRTYRCADGRFVAVGAIESKFYLQFLELVGLAGDIDPKLQHDQASWPETERRFAERFATRSRDEWAQIFAGSDACVSPVLDFNEAARHPHNLANRLYMNEPFVQPAPVIAFERGGHSG